MAKCPVGSKKTNSCVCIVCEGRAASSITVTDGKDRIVKFAASELQRYIEKISGARIVIKKGGKVKEGEVEIALEIKKLRGLPSDSFRITATRSKITLTGTNSRGVLYSVYALLEQLGCAWVYPGEAEEIVPELSTIAIPVGSKTEKPSIEHRGLGLYGICKKNIELGRAVLDWMAKNRLNLFMSSNDRHDPWDPTDTQRMWWSEVRGELLPEVLKRGFIFDMTEHSTRDFFPRSLFKKHPEWFSLIDGKRRDTQMCYANDDAVDYYVKQQVKYAKKHPEIDILGTWPLDGGGYCECEECAKPDVIFKASAKVANAVAKVRPDLVIEYLAYKSQTFPVPTTVKIPKNVSSLVCNRLDDVAREWAKAMRNKCGAYHFEYKMGDNFHNNTNTWVNPAFARELARTCIDIGFRGVISLFLPMNNWWRSGFNTYIFARTCWEPDMDLSATMRRYYASYYGDQAKEAREIFNLIFKKMQSKKVWTHLYSSVRQRRKTYDSALNKEVRKASTQIIKLINAAQKSSTNKTVANRFRRIKTYVEAFQLYADYIAVRGKDRNKRSDEAYKKYRVYSQSHPAEKDGICIPVEFLDWKLGHNPEELGLGATD